MNNLKKRKVIFSIIALVLFLICVCGNFYTIDSYAVRSYFTKASSISARLYSGDVLEQEFTLGEGDQGVQVILGTYVTVLEKGTVLAELFDENGEKIAETEVKLEGTTDNQYVNFYFGNLDESLYNQKYKVRFTFTDINEQLIAVYNSKIDIDKYEYTINGEVQEYNLAMNGIKETTYVEYRDFRLFYIFGIGVIALYFAMFKLKWRKIDFHAIKEKCISFIKDNKKHILTVAGITIGSVIFTFIRNYKKIFVSDYINPYNLYRVFLIVFIIALVWAFRDYVLKRTHLFFFIVSMLVGSICIISNPPIAVGWDEQLHYANTTYMSWGATDRISEADYMIYSMYNESKYEDIYSKEQRKAWIEEINSVDAQGTMVEYLQGVSAGSVAYVIPSIVLYVTRILGVDFVTRFMLGRFTNLLLYSLFLAMAIKLLKGRGKLLITTIGLIPTNILLASCYGFDWWIISLIILGYSTFIGEIQEKGYVSTKKMLQSVAIMGIGMLPKAVYFPLMLPMMLMKKERYEDSKKSRAIVVLGMIALVLSFMLPILISIDSGATAGGGDIRGGNDVNALAQINYILSNFQEFANMLKNFMRVYLSPDQAMKYLTEMSSLGRGQYHTICLILIAIAALMDNSKRTTFEKEDLWAIIGNYFGVVLSVILVATALYISYTPVGHTWINGCQPRYILPVLFPFLYIAGENHFEVSEEMKRKTFIWCIIGMAYVSLWAFNSYFIINY